MKVNFWLCFTCIFTFATVVIYTFMYCFHMCFEVALFFWWYITFFTIKILPPSSLTVFFELHLQRGQHLVAGQACGTCNPDQGWCDPSQGAVIRGLPGLRSVTLPQGAVTLSKGWCLPITGAGCLPRERGIPVNRNLDSQSSSVIPVQFLLRLLCTP